MKLVHIEYLIEKGNFRSSSEWRSILDDISDAIAKVVWPPGNNSFVLNPSRGRGRGEGNGVKPIKDACMVVLRSRGWATDERKNPYRLDAVKHLSNGTYFGLEWETGNVSSTHRSVNRILLAHQEGRLVGGAVIVPTRALYGYLTDRVGNFDELRPYFRLWHSYVWENGILAIIAVEHDGIDQSIPRIGKGTNGRALV
jgi:hypothetical protein